MRTRAAIGLGSNVGDRRAHLKRATELLDSIGRRTGTSSLYETAPLGGPDQDNYLNAVALIETDLGPRAVLDELLSIERELGRIRGERWGPRTIDLDLLLYGAAIVDEPGLTVPHPELTRRRFVIEPLLEVWPDSVLPDGTTIESLLPGVAQQEVTRVRPNRATGTPSAGLVFAVVAAAAVALWWIVGRML